MGYRVRRLLRMLRLDRRQAFISYRRRDFPTARVVHEWAVGRYGRSRVFLDHEDNVGADHWAEHVERAVLGSAAMVVVVGRGWVERTAELIEQPDGHEHREEDWVRRELLLAAESDVAIRPFYAPDPEMPAALSGVKDIPEDIATVLTTPQVVTARQDQFAAGLRDLGKSLDPVMGIWNRLVVRLAALGVAALAIVALAAWGGCRIAGCFDTSPFADNVLGVVVADDYGGVDVGTGTESAIAEQLMSELEAAFGPSAEVEVRVGGEIDPQAADGGAEAASELIDRHNAAVVVSGTVEQNARRTSFVPVAYLGELPDLEEFSGRRLTLRLGEGFTNRDLDEAGSVTELADGIVFDPLVRLLDGTDAYTRDQFGATLEVLADNLDDYDGLERAVVEQTVGNTHEVLGDFATARRHFAAAAEYGDPFPRGDISALGAEFRDIEARGGCEGEDPDALRLLETRALQLAESLGTEPLVVRAKADVTAARIAVCRALGAANIDTIEVRRAAENLADVVGIEDPPDELNEAVVLAARTLAIIMGQARRDAEASLMAELLEGLPATVPAPPDTEATDVRVAMAQDGVLTVGIDVNRRPTLRAMAYVDRGNLRRLTLGRDADAYADYEAACIDLRGVLAPLRGNRYEADDGLERDLEERIVGIDISMYQTDQTDATDACSAQ